MLLQKSTVWGKLCNAIIRFYHNASKEERWNVVAKKHLSLAQNLTFESSFPSSVKLASYGFLVCVFIFLKLLRTVKQTLHLVPSSLIFSGLINGAAGRIHYLDTCHGSSEEDNNQQQYQAYKCSLWGSSGDEQVIGHSHLLHSLWPTPLLCCAVDLASAAYRKT